jgi:hypothetical protein
MKKSTQNGVDFCFYEIKTNLCVNPPPLIRKTQEEQFLNLLLHTTIPQYF